MADAIVETNNQIPETLIGATKTEPATEPECTDDNLDIAGGYLEPLCEITEMPSEDSDWDQGTIEKQPEEPEDVPNEPLPSMEVLPIEVKVTEPSTIATPEIIFPTSTRKTKAQKQREYRQRLAASRTPEQLAAAREAKNERQRRNRLRQAAKLAKASGSVEATTTSSSPGEESNNVQTRSQLKHAQQSTTSADQPDDANPNVPLPPDAQETVASSSAAPFAKPKTVGPKKTRAQIQREYRQRLAATRTAAQAAAARKAKNERERRNRQRQAANLAKPSSGLEASTTSSSRSGQRLNDDIDSQQELTEQQRQNLLLLLLLNNINRRAAIG